ncbi:MAG: phospho-2-dehydro-3-deoxyheptonate aldolase [marine bacterium B5-7]|nr:MAG: phospho-2-dehydro-3-deoxyheptonate aldolase [marine bacterium B5-7]
MPTDDLRIAKVHSLVPPAVLHEELPATDAVQRFVADARDQAAKVLFANDPRLLVVVGPCSVHDPLALVDYAERLKPIADEVASRLVLVLRVYFEKPRTVVGWKGLINDPDLDGSHRINTGLRRAREVLLKVANIGLPAGTEFLDATFGQYFTDLITWGAIGARTVESQIHRQLASALSMPVGIKNRTDGDVKVAVDAIRAARHPHLFPTINKQGTAAIMETTGNDQCHLVLRGGDKPNYDHDHVTDAIRQLSGAGMPETIMVDCSHANSSKKPENQPEVAFDVINQRREGTDALRGLMIESHIESGRQDIGSELIYGKSITDACLGFDDTRRLLLDLAGKI